MARTKKNAPVDQENQVSLTETAEAVEETATEEIVLVTVEEPVAESAPEAPIEAVSDPESVNKPREPVEAPENGDTGDEKPQAPEENAGSKEENDFTQRSLFLPKSMFDQSPGSLNRLKAAIQSKQTLLKKSLGTDSLEFFIEDDCVIFPWFNLNEASIAEKEAYSKLVLALAKKAITQSRVSSEEKVYEDERQGMRLYLINLDFKGDEYKTARAILMKNFATSPAGNAVRKTDFVFTKPEVYVRKPKTEEKTDEK